MTINEARSLAMNEAHKANKDKKFQTWGECLSFGWKVAKNWYAPASKYEVEIIKETEKAVLIACEVIEYEDDPKGKVVIKNVWYPKRQMSTPNKTNYLFWFSKVLYFEAETTIVKLSNGTVITQENCEMKN